MIQVKLFEKTIVVNVTSSGGYVDSSEGLETVHEMGLETVKSAIQGDVEVQILRAFLNRILSVAFEGSVHDHGAWKQPIQSMFVELKINIHVLQSGSGPNKQVKHRMDVRTDP